VVDTLKTVIQQDLTGCAIASSAAIAGTSYFEAKRIANVLGISTEDSSLWSETMNIRALLQEFGFRTSSGETPFESWQSLPDCALLSIKWHLENSKPHWHWVVFVRENGQEYVLDSNKGLKRNRRTDFGRMNPRWYIEVSGQRPIPVDSD